MLPQDRVVSDRDEGGHVQRGSDRCAAALDVPVAAVVAGVVVERSDPDQGSDLASADMPQFGQFAHQHAADTQADAADAQQRLLAGVQDRCWSMSV